VVTLKEKKAGKKLDHRKKLIGRGGLAQIRLAWKAIQRRKDPVYNEKRREWKGKIFEAGGRGGGETKREKKRGLKNNNWEVRGGYPEGGTHKSGPNGINRCSKEGNQKTEKRYGGDKQREEI